MRAQSINSAAPKPTANIGGGGGKGSVFKNLMGNNQMVQQQALQ